MNGKANGFKILRKKAEFYVTIVIQGCIWKGLAQNRILFPDIFPPLAVHLKANKISRRNLIRINNMKFHEIVTKSIIGATINSFVFLVIFKKYINNNNVNKRIKYIIFI